MCPFMKEDVLQSKHRSRSWFVFHPDQAASKSSVRSLKYRLLKQVMWTQTDKEWSSFIFLLVLIRSSLDQSSWSAESIHESLSVFGIRRTKRRKVSFFWMLWENISVVFLQTKCLGQTVVTEIVVRAPFLSFLISIVVSLVWKERVKYIRKQTKEQTKNRPKTY